LSSQTNLNKLIIGMKLFTVTVSNRQSIFYKKMS